jgi:hypothetical protein
MIRKAKASEIDQIILITRACASKMKSDGVFQWDDAYPNKQVFEKDLKRGDYISFWPKKPFWAV